MNGDWSPNSLYPQAALTQDNLHGSAYSSLPQEPGAYEDFNFSAPFELTELLATTPTARTPLPLALAPSFNPFDPATLGFGDPFSPGFMPHPSTSSSSPSFPTTHLPPQPSELPGQPPPPLLDAGESALFGNFLEGIGGNNGFLFDPVLPPGMPSPPSELVRGETREERRERDRLGEEVRSLHLGVATNGAGGGWQSQPQQQQQQHAHSNHMSSHPNSAGPTRDDVRFAQPPAPGMIKSEFSTSPPTLSTSHAHSQSASASTSRTRGTTRALEEQATGGRGNKLHKITHQMALEDDEEEEEGDTMMREDEGEDAGTTAARRRPSRGATTSRRRHSSVARNGSQPSILQQPPAHVTTAPPPPPMASSMVRPRSNSSSSVGAPASTAGGERRAPLTESEKRQNHILSEQRRRNQIKVGFASLVDLLAAGEQASGISIKGAAEDGGEGAKGKKKGRGRGRKGDVGGGASKSVVLQKAARYVVWLEGGNDAIEEEIQRVEGLLARI